MPGVQSVFVFVALRCAPRPFPGVLFCSGPVPAPNGASPSPAIPRGRSKKKTPWVVFCFLLWPRAGAQRGFSFPCLSPGPQQKKKKNTLGGVFFLLWPRAGTGLLLPLPFPGAGAKKKSTLGVFFLLRPRADAHSLTAGLGGDASPSPGWCLFFAAAPPGPGWCFFFLLWPRPDAHSLTVGWGDSGKARVRPHRVFLDNNKKCLGYYIGSKKTRRGHSKKKKTPLPLGV